MAIKRRKNGLRLVPKQIRKQSLRNKSCGESVCEREAYANESSIIDNMTDNEVLSYFFDNDEGEPIPRELVLALKRRAVACLKENNIPIPDSLKGI